MTSRVPSVRPSKSTDGRTARRRWTTFGFLAPYYVPFTLFFLAPIVYAVVQSTVGVRREGGLLGSSQTVFVGIENYVRALSDPAFGESILRVFLFALVQVPIMALGSTALALLLDATRPRIAAIFRSLYFLPYAVPGVIAAIMWATLYQPSTSPLGDIGIEINILNSALVLPSLANIGLWVFLGYNVILLVTALTSIPQEIYEAARIDGASSWRIALQIKLPLIRPTIVMTIVFSLIGTLQLFTEPQVLRSVSQRITSGYTPNMLAYQAAVSNDYGYSAALSVILAVATFTLSILFLRIVQGKSSK